MLVVSNMGPSDQGGEADEAYDSLVQQMFRIQIAKIEKNIDELRKQATWEHAY